MNVRQLFIVFSVFYCSVYSEVLPYGYHMNVGVPKANVLRSLESNRIIGGTQVESASAIPHHVSGLVIPLHFQLLDSNHDLNQRSSNNFLQLCPCLFFLCPIFYSMECASIEYHRMSTNRSGFKAKVRQFFKNVLAESKQTFPLFNISIDIY